MAAYDVDAVRLRDAFWTHIPAASRAVVKRIVDTAAARGDAYAVGGVVRDLLLGRAVVDIDLVTEGDAIEIARAALPDAKVTTHARFRTASVGGRGCRVDLATARRERYARPGALPAVQPAGIEADLRRRDFSINALALRLTGEPALLDPCTGLADLDAGRVRVLHDGSFADDATRIFRAARYAARLGFSIEPHTMRLLRASLEYAGTIGGERLRRELELMLAEETAGAALTLCHDVGGLRAIDPGLAWDAHRSGALGSGIARHAPRIEFGFALLAAAASREDADRICERLRLKRRESAAVRGIASMRAVAGMLRRPDAKPSGVVGLLDRYPLAAVAAFAATDGDAIARHLALRYLEEWRRVKPILTGEDLLEMGVPQGPLVQRGLQLVRAARLDGRAGDRDDERALVRRFAKSIRDSGGMNTNIEFDTDGN